MKDGTKAISRKKSERKEKIRFYLWAGLAYLLVWLFTDLVNYTSTFPERSVNEAWRIAFVIGLNFIFFEYAFPFVRRKRKYLIYNIILFIPVLWIFMMLGSFGLHAWRSIGIGLNVYTPLATYASIYEGLSAQASFGIMSLIFFGIIKHIYDYRKLAESAQRLKIEKQAAELNYLKSQTNPHFLFNTLNNIYSLARDKSDLAPESILRLSKILRFMLYETGGEYISIEQELKIINDYIALEKLRYDDSLRIDLNIKVDDMKLQLPPLLLIPLVENAFKHGVSESGDNPFISISITSGQKNIEMVVTNSADGPAGEVKENIGLANIRRQLELLYKDYDLSFLKSESQFKARLMINLATHV